MKGTKKTIRKTPPPSPERRDQAPPDFEQLSRLLQLEAPSLQFEDTVQQLLSIPQQAVYIFNHQTQHMVLGGEHNAALYGYTEAEINALPHKWASVAHPDDIPQYEKLLARLQAAPPGATVSGVFRILRKDGRFERVTLFRRVWQRDTEGNILLEIGMAQILNPLIEAAQQAEINTSTLDAVVRNAAEGAVVVDAKGVITHLNALAASVLQFNKTDAIGKPLRSLLSSSLATKLHKALALAKTTGQASLSGQLDRSQPEAAPHDLHLSLLPRDHVLIQLRPASESRPTDSPEIGRDGCYRGLFENNSSGVVVFDASLQVEDANAAFRKLLGLKLRDLDDLSLRDIISLDGRDAFGDFIRTLKNPASPNTATTLILRHSNGTERHVRASPTSFFDQKNRFTKGILILTDITAQRRTERALHAELAINQIFFNQTPMLVAMISPDGRLIRINPAGERLFGFRSAELEGRVIWDLQVMDPVEIERSRQRVHQLLAGKLTRVGSIMHLQTRSGQVRTIEAETVPVVDLENNIEMIVSTGVDITERRELESEVIRSIDQEQLRIGHDLHDGIGQMLTGIVSLTESLRSKLDAPLQSEVDRILELVHQTLSDARSLAHGLSPAIIQSRGLRGGLELIVDRMKGHFPGQCTLHCEKNLEIHDLEVATHLYRIAQEAVSNAAKHSHAHNLSITLSRLTNDRASLEIKDDGDGFDAKKINGASGIGLKVIDYRTSLIHGNLQIVGSQKKGVRVICCFPNATPTRKSLTKRYKPANHNPHEA